MTERYKRYTRNKFKKWRQRVSLYLPSLAIAFYNHELECGVPYEKHVLLGKVIKNINDPFYSIQGPDGKSLDEQSAMIDEIILSIQVNNLFSFCKKINYEPRKPGRGLNPPYTRIQVNNSSISRVGFDRYFGR